MKKKLIICLAALITVLSGCKTKTTTTSKKIIYSSLSNADSVVYNGSFNNKNYSITKNELFEQVKVDDGITQITEMIDTYLLSDYISKVTQEEITKKINYLTYGLSTDESIELLNEETKAESEENFKTGMFVLGYRNDEAIEKYAKLLIARENYVKDVIYKGTKDDDYYVAEDKIKTYYDETYYEPAHALIIAFDSEQDAKNVLKLLGLVKYNKKLYKYTGTDINNVSPSLLNDSNTQALTDDEIFTYYLKMYNIVYQGIKPTINENLTKETFLASDIADNFKYEVNDLSSSNYTLAEYVFTNLSIKNNNFYSIDPKKAPVSTDNTHYMVYKISEPEKAEEIPADVYTYIKNTIIETSMLTSTIINDVIYDLRRDKNIQIYDHYLEIDYSSLDADYKNDNAGSTDKIASVDGYTITADDLYDYTTGKNFEVYIVNAAVMKVVRNLEQWTLYYGTETNLDKNKAEKIKTYRDSLASIKESYTDENTSFADYLYLAVGAKSENDVILSYFMKNEMKSFLVFEDIFSNEHFTEYFEEYIDEFIEEYYENYFSLNVYHILFYVDLDNNGVADDYTKYLEKLEEYNFKKTNGQPITNYEAYYNDLVVELNEKLNNALKDNSTASALSALVKEYNNADRNGDSTWAKFKNLGFHITYENLSSSASLTYESTKDSYDKTFVNRLIDLYKLYNEEENSSLTSLLDTELTSTSFGLHKILVEKGTEFQKPSAVFEDDDNSGYDVRLLNDYEMPSLSQLEVYFLYNFYSTVYGDEENVETKYNFKMPVVNTDLMTKIGNIVADISETIYTDANIYRLVADYLANDNNEYKDSFAKLTQIYKEYVFK